MAGSGSKFITMEELGVDINKDFILNNVILCVESGTVKGNYVSYSLFDMRTYFRVIIDGEKSFRITKKLMNALEILFDELLDAAVKNTRAKLKIQNLGCVLFGEKDRNAPDILSIEGMMFGAGVIGMVNIYEELCKKHGVDHCYILPSSIHEILVHYPHGVETKEDFDCLVQSVNEQEVLPEDRLADHCYVYRLGSYTLEY